ncbi:alpha/beta hydrolase [Gordonia sp. LSe1-13]|uniref:Alpha/beta hydrolase n=1 Tax=Gordonia sesuvii TaxID=3116777 RepID=A0ABU7MIY1_9ACTN|nr:alpha/beta hydrolase [Gordonia sp. LSe1-13]
MTVTGPPDGPPVLLLHGGGATSMAWTALIERIGGTGHRFVAPDLIGDPGRSRNTGDRLRTVDDLCAWVNTVLTETSCERVDVVAHSYGAMLALAYAVRFPERVGRLILLDPNSCFAGISPRYLMHALPILLRPNERRERRFLGWETDGAALDADWVELVASGAEGFPSSRTVVPRRPGRTDLAGLNGHRVTVVLAPGSRVHRPPRIADRVADLMPAASVVMLSAGTHHTLPMSPSDELAGVVRNALDEGLRDQGRALH